MNIFTKVIDKLFNISKKPTGTPRNPKYSWIPDLPDKRDLRYRIAAPTNVKFVDLRGSCPAVYNQGDIGSCTANAIAGASEFLWLKNGTDFMPSRLFIYYNERDSEGTVDQDAGAMIRDGIKTIASIGECSEDTWPYLPDRFTWKPSDASYAEAVKHKALTYTRISENLNDMKSCLASGVPFVFGFTVYESFESNAVAQSGILPMPGPNESTLGGHAVLAVGFDDSKQMFIVRNSWGEDWGDHGYFYMPYTYISDPNLADDRWSVSAFAS